MPILCRIQDGALLAFELDSLSTTPKYDKPTVNELILKNCSLKEIITIYLLDLLITLFHFFGLILSCIDLITEDMGNAFVT